MSANLLKKALPFDNLFQTLRRFPLSVLCTLYIFVLAVLGMNDRVSPEGGLVEYGLPMAVIGFFWFGIARIFAESKGWGIAQHVVLALAGFALISTPLFLTDQIFIYMAFIIPTLLLMVMIAPFANAARNDNYSFWVYNKNIWVGVFLASLASSILSSGLSIALGSVISLFDAEFSEKNFLYIAIFISTIFVPIFSLSWVPRQFVFTDEQNKNLPGLEFILNWILAPLVLIYFLIIYSYFIKILFIGELPKGELALMVTGFAGVGIATYLIGWVFNESAKALPLFKLIHRWLFPALIIPVIMQAIAIGVRINAYGVTEERYAVLMSVIWLAAITVLFVARKMPIKIIPGFLAVLLIIASVGPLSALSVSKYSQWNRFHEFIERHQLAKDGKFVTPAAKIEDKTDISSIVQFLGERGEQEKLLAYTNKGEVQQSCNEEWTYECNAQYLSAMGMQDEIYAPLNNSYFELISDQMGRTIDIGGYDRVYQDVEIGYGSVTELSGLKITKDVNIMTLKAENAQPLSIDIEPLLIEAIPDMAGPHYMEFTADAKNTDVKAKFVFHKIRGMNIGGKHEIDQMIFDLYIKRL